ncbi:MAG: hypothetical protein KAR07_07745 [Spirochaetes bacterium]|nr:hypothetical protein [Spirochaetota bacterium]
MAEIELSLDELKTLITQGRQFTLAENFYHNRNIFIGKERVLSIKDVGRMEDKAYGKIKVKEFKDSGVESSLKNEIIQLCIKALKQHRDYKGLPAEKRKRIEQIFLNVLPHHDYVCYRISQIKKASPRIFVHSVNTAIKSLIVDFAMQARHNQGLQNSIQSEEILVASLLRNLGFLKTSKDVIAKKIGDLRLEKNKLFFQIPIFSTEIVEKDRTKHDLSINTIRAMRESFEKSDASGYPEGLEKNQIHPLALLIATCSEFDLLLSGELTQDRRSYMEVIRRLTGLINEFDRNIVNIIAEEFRYMRDSRDDNTSSIQVH